MAINDNTNKINELINAINSLPVAGSGSGGSADGAEGECKEILYVRWNSDTQKYSHKASEIISSHNDGKIIYVETWGSNAFFIGESGGAAEFCYSYIDNNNRVYSGCFYILEDGSEVWYEDDEYRTQTIPVFYMYDDSFGEVLLSDDFDYIYNNVFYSGGPFVISYNGYTYEYNNYDQYGMHFIYIDHYDSEYRSVCTILISWDGLVTFFTREEPVIPILAEPEGGEVCTMHADGTVSWEKLDGQSSGVLNVRWDNDAGRYSHTASEIISAANDGKTIIVDNSLDVIFNGEVDGVAGFTYSYLTSENCIVKGYFYILDDGSYADDGYEHKTSTVSVLYLRYAEGELNEEQFNYIMHGVWNNNGLAVISNNNEVYKFDSYDENNVYFVHTFCNTDTRYINTIAISTKGVISYFSRTEPIIPVLAEPEGGEVLTMSTSGSVSWEKPSTKTLTEMLMDEDLILNERHFGDELPDYGTPGRIFFLRKSEV